MIAAVETTDVLGTLKNFFGFNRFKANQEKIIRNLLDGNDGFVIMPTGGGKSLCYQLPALMLEGTAIVVSPLIALMKNQVDALRGFGNEKGLAHFLNSSLNKGDMMQVKKDVLDGVTKLLYIAPETLTKEENTTFFKEFKISFLVILTLFAANISCSNPPIITYCFVSIKVLSEIAQIPKLLLHW